MNPATVKPKNKGTKQLFKNPVIERLSRTNSAIPITMFVVVGIYMMYWGIVNTSISGWSVAGLFVVGVVTFTLVEYMVHKHVFHMIADSERAQKIKYNFHGVHHEYPKDTGRLAMPPLISALIITILYYLFEAIMGVNVYGFLPGFLVGYSAYLGVHYMIHAYQPPNNIFKVLWINHGIHHYKNDDIAFGVSSPMWDYILGTLPDKKKRNKAA